MNLKETIMSLCGLMSVSGNEKAASAELDAIMGSVFDEHLVDPMGNHLFIKKCGRENAPKILIDTHFDEIGMMVTGIKAGGFVTVTNVGGVDTRILQAGEVIIYGKEPVYGVFTSTPPHFRKPGESDKLSTMDQLCIDTGYTKEALEEIVPLGTPVGFKPVYGELMNGRIYGKAFDDKACGACAVWALADIPTSELAGDVYFLFSAEEEVGCRGAATAAFGVSPDYALIMDVTHAAVPEVKERNLSPFDSGVVVEVAAATDRKLTFMVKDLCDKGEIPYTVQACPGSTGTNANVLGMSIDGIPSVLCSLPLKSMHSAAEVISLKDAEALGNLTKAFVTSNEIAEVYTR
ncbi:MAG: M20/M25/M40 family metallo-hydrolase [Clostridia bacterium]|nr:M20/M25/M40 family metallo-hydrolase [Clostridia bacterium]